MEEVKEAPAQLLFLYEGTHQRIVLILKEIMKHIKRYYNKSPRPKDILPRVPEELHCEIAELITDVQAEM